jgi:hypothetical protein
MCSRQHGSRRTGLLEGRGKPYEASTRTRLRARSGAAILWSSAGCATPFRPRPTIRFLVMSLVRRLTGFASALLVVLVQFALAGDGGRACAEHPGMPPIGDVRATAPDMASMSGMAGMPAMPTHDGDRSSRDGGCPDSGMRGDECHAMSACTSIMAIAEQVAWTAAAATPSGAVPVAQLVPYLLSLPPESPPPRA